MDLYDQRSKLTHQFMKNGLALFITFILATPIWGASEESTYVLDQYAPRLKDLARWEEDVAKLIEFGKTPEFISYSLTKADEDVRSDLETACQLKSFPDCRDYIRAHRQQIIRALPNNPVYWDRFWQVLGIPNIVDLGTEIGRTMDGNGHVIRASYFWFYRNLAMHGRLDLEEAAILLQGVRNWRTGHQSLIARMIALAVNGITLNQASFAMAQASRDRDEQTLHQLASLVSPLSLEEMHWGPILWSERELSMRQLQIVADPQAPEAVDLDYWLSQVTDELSEQAIRLAHGDPIEFYKSDFDILARLFVDVSSAPWPKYWQEGVPDFGPDQFPTFSLMKIAAPAYQSYIETDRSAHFLAFLFPPLIDIYAGRASPGIPSRPAPAHWHWQWLDGDQPQLCLAAIDIHPSTKSWAKGQPERYCVDYYDEKAVASLHLN